MFSGYSGGVKNKLRPNASSTGVRCLGRAWKRPISDNLLKYNFAKNIYERKMRTEMAKSVCRDATRCKWERNKMEGVARVPEKCLKPRNGVYFQFTDTRHTRSSLPHNRHALIHSAHSWIAILFLVQLIPSEWRCVKCIFCAKSCNSNLKCYSIYEWLACARDLFTRRHFKRISRRHTSRSVIFVRALWSCALSRSQFMQ